MKRIRQKYFRLPWLILVAVSVLVFAACRPVDSTPPPAAGNSVLRVVSSGGFSAAYQELAPLFEAETGISLTTAYGASIGGSYNSIPMRLERNEQFDVIVLSRPSLDNLTAAGKVDPESHTDLADSRIGMAVRVGAELPDISTPDAYIQTLRDAESIGYSASASGTYLSQTLWPRLGIWQELEPKSLRVEGERVAAVVARGDLETGFQQISEILPDPGVILVGPIPEELQEVTTFSAAVPVNAVNREGARRLLEYLSSEAVAAQIEATGLEPVANSRQAGRPVN